MPVNVRKLRFQSPKNIFTKGFFIYLDSGTWPSSEYLDKTGITGFIRAMSGKIWFLIDDRKKCTRKSHKISLIISCSVEPIKMTFHFQGSTKIANIYHLEHIAAKPVHTLLYVRFYTLHL